MADTRMIAVDPKDLSIWMPALAPFFGGVAECSARKFEVPHVFERAAQHLTQLWTAMDDDYNLVGAAASELVDYPGRRVCRLWLVGGEVDRIIPHLIEIESYARVEKCVALEIDGPPDIRRVLRVEGYQLAHITMEKEL